MATTSKAQGKTNPDSYANLEDITLLSQLHELATRPLAKMTSDELIDTYHDADEAAKAFGKVKDAMRDEMAKRIDAGRHVRGRAQKAILQAAERRTYSVVALMAQIRKFNLKNASELLKASNRAVDALPDKIKDAVPFVRDWDEKVNLKPLGWAPAKNAKHSHKE